MRSYGGCGRSGRDYTGAEDVLKGRLMDEGTEYVVPSNVDDDLEDDELPLAEVEDRTHEAIDSELQRWGFDLADSRYFE